MSFSHHNIYMYEDFFISSLHIHVHTYTCTQYVTAMHTNMYTDNAFLQFTRLSKRND